MAITKTIEFRKANVFPKKDSSAASTTNDGNPIIVVAEKITLDDTEDDDLPVVHSQVRTIYRYVADGGAATDISSEDALVQTIAGAIWS
tara:strand:+ start:614 stop:880 length:267 start_codon:yes stop_codon:yes gene_type:complete